VNKGFSIYLSLYHILYLNLPNLVKKNIPIKTWQKCFPLHPIIPGHLSHLTCLPEMLNLLLTIQGETFLQRPLPSKQIWSTDGIYIFFSHLFDQSAQFKQLNKCIRSVQFCSAWPRKTLFVEGVNLENSRMFQMMLLYKVYKSKDHSSVQ
jgi:hypothetical protein